MKKIFEEPTIECVRITTEKIAADGEGGLLEPSFGTVPDPFG